MTPRECQNSLIIESLPFRRLIVEDKELAGARREFALKPVEERRAAASFYYHDGKAQRIFDQLTGLSKGDPWRSEVLALAIDPEYAPAALTVRSLEDQFGRRDEAMSLFN